MDRKTVDRTLALALKLLEISSQTPLDKGCQEFLIERLLPLGFVIERFRCGEVDNLYARRGKSSPLLVFAGHTDVVPTGPTELWNSPPFTPTIRDGKLYARGSADMKTSLAAFITAIEDFIEQYPQHLGSIGLLITSDEEGSAVNGTTQVVKILQKRGERIDFCIVGEPTCQNQLGDTVKNGRRGSLSGSLVVKGVQGHIAYPHLAKNPIHLVAPALTELVQTHWDDGNAFFPPTSFQISNIQSGTGATNVIPGEITVLFNFRFSTASTAESLKNRVGAILDEHKLDYAIDWGLSNSYLTSPQALCSALEQAIHQHCQIMPELSTTGGTSDGRFIADICPQVVEFGPVNATIHKIDEYILVDDIAKLSAIYQTTMELLLKG